MRGGLEDCPRWCSWINVPGAKAPSCLRWNNWAKARAISEVEPKGSYTRGVNAYKKGLIKARALPSAAKPAFILEALRHG